MEEEQHMKHKINSLGLSRQISGQSISRCERSSEDKVGTMITRWRHKSCNHSLVRQTNGLQRHRARDKVWCGQRKQKPGWLTKGRGEKQASSWCSKATRTAVTRWLTTNFNGCFKITHHYRNNVLPRAYFTSSCLFGIIISTFRT